MHPTWRRWDKSYSSFPARVGGWPLELDKVLGNELFNAGLPEAEEPAGTPQLADAAAALMCQAVAPPAPPAAALGGRIPLAGILEHLPPVCNAADVAKAPRSVSSAAWARPEMEVLQGPSVPPLTRTAWQSCATIAPQPAERWLSLAFSLEPQLEPRTVSAPQLQVSFEAAECFYDSNGKPPKPVEAWMWCPGAQAAERWIEIAMAGHLGLALPAVHFEAFGMEIAWAAVFRDAGELPPAACENWAQTPAPEPVEHWLRVAGAGPVWNANVALPHFPDTVTACAPALAEALPGPAPEAVERPAVAAMSATLEAGTHDAQIIPFAVAPHGAEIFRDPAGEPPALADIARTPAAEPVERWLATAFASPMAAPQADLRLMPPALNAVVPNVFRDAGEAPPALADTFMPLPAAEPVERWLATAFASPMAAPQANLRLMPPALNAVVPNVFRDAGEAPPALADTFMPLPAAEPVERWLATAFASPMAAPQANLRLMPPALNAVVPNVFRDAGEAPPALADTFMPLPAAEPVERWLATAFASPMAAPLADLRLMPPALNAVVPNVFRDAGEAPPALALPAAEPVENWLAMAVASEIEPQDGARELPFAVAPVVPNILRDPGEAPPAVVDTFMPLPAAEPAERWLASSVAKEIAPSIAATAPAFSVSLVSPFVPFVPRFARPDAAEPAAAFVKPVFRPLPLQSQVALPALPHRIGRTIQGAPREAALARAANGPQASPVESIPSTTKLPIPIRRSPAVPDIPPVAARVRLAPAGVTEIYPAAARSAAAVMASIPLRPVETVTAQAPPVEIQRPTPQIPEPGLYGLEYYCQRGSGAPSSRLAWAPPPIPPAALRFQLKPAFETLEEPEVPKPARKGPAIAEIFSLPEARKRTSSSRLGWVGKVAAGIMVMFALWSGSRLAEIGKPPANVARDTAAPQISEDPQPVVARAAVPPKGPLARIRQSLASRAAVSVGDTFHGGMEAWGSGSKSYAPGWAHSPDGYVRVGDLALFRPTQTFQDYRLEFYGQIEKKSMSWVMRARDKKNYYAMKFTVVEPGLRPVIAMVHYPVVGGKKGHKVETPLSVMFHNNEAYHVTVDVKGNRFTASIEGEKVDSWTDDTPGAGAVGFFSEAGESARLYWAKVSKNQDWIGRFCSYFAGDEANRTAELWNSGLPPDSPAPKIPRAHDFVVDAALEVETEFNFAPRGASRQMNWRIPAWNS